MVKNILLAITLLVCMKLNGQQPDSLQCERYFEHFEALLEDKLIIVWETAPSIKKDSKYKLGNVRKMVKEHTCYASLRVSIIVNSKGIPLCYRFYDRLEPDVKKILIKELSTLRFNPALQKGSEVTSIYSLLLKTM